MKNTLIYLIFIIGVICIAPIKKIDNCKKIISLLLISLMASFLLNEVIFREILTAKQSIKITALGEKNKDAQGNEIWIKGVIVDKKWYNAVDIFKNTNWIKKDDHILIWRDYDISDEISDTITGEIPYGEKINIVFDSNIWRGKLKFNIENKYEKIIDTYKNVEDSEDIAKDVPFFETERYKFVEKNKIYIQFVIFLLTALMVFFLEFKFGKKYKDNKYNIEKRVMWIDVLRSVCAFTIVLLHCTNNTYNNFTDDTFKWYNYLYMNCFTTFAVPIFFMLSGILIIKENINIRKNLKKVLYFFIQLFVWSIIYIIFRKYFYNENISIIESILKTPFTPQAWHLWFMYDILSIYFLLPIISFCYYRLDKKLKTYLFFLLFVIPAIIITMTTALQKNISMPLFAIGFPSLGVFLLGKILYDSKIKDNKILYITLLIIGYILMVVGNYYISIKQGRPVNAFIGSYGTIPVIIYSIGIFGIFMSFRDNFNNINKTFKNAILFISKNSIGIYFSHILVKDIIGNINIGNILISSNNGSNFNMFLGALLYFTFSLLLSNIFLKSVFWGKLLVNSN